jgi:hypothetical protein
LAPIFVTLASRGTAGRLERSSLGFALVLPDREYTEVHQILELTGLGPTFVIFGKLDAALEAVRTSRIDEPPVRAA